MNVTSSLDLQVWLQAALGAASEFANASLGMDLKQVDDGYHLPPELTGCFVALIGDSGSLQVGFGSNPEGCQSLAKVLFASTEDLPEEDVSDALGEIANIIAGGVKKRMAAGQPPLAISLPIVMQGHIRLTDRQHLLETEVLIGDVPVRLLVISNK